MSIHADHVPIEGQLLIQTQLSNLPIPPNRANPCQFSANRLPIQCQSMSIFCQSGAIPRSIFPFNDHFPISQSSANPVPIGQSGANLVPIGQSGANQPIWCQSANRPIQCQSANPVPIRANPEPIRANPCQSSANRGSIFHSNSVPIRSQSWANRPIRCQSSANRPIRCQSANPVPIRCQFANSKAILR